MPKRFFDFISPIYDYIIRGTLPNSLLNYIQINSSKHERILDIGAGTGRSLKNIALKNNHMWLLDPSIHMLRHARKNLPQIKLVHGYAERLPFKKNFFDRILAIDSFHHWDNHLKGLKEINRVLKLEGRFILMDYNPNTKGGHFIKSMEFVLKMGSTFFNLNQIHALHSRAGLKILNQEHFANGAFIIISSPE